MSPNHQQMQAQQAPHPEQIKAMIAALEQVAATLLKRETACSGLAGFARTNGVYLFKDLAPNLADTLIALAADYFESTAGQISIDRGHVQVQIQNLRGALDAITRAASPIVIPGGNGMVF